MNDDEFRELQQKAMIAERQVAFLSRELREARIRAKALRARWRKEKRERKAYP